LKTTLPGPLDSGRLLHLKTCQRFTRSHYPLHKPLLVRHFVHSVHEMVQTLTVVWLTWTN